QRGGVEVVVAQAARCELVDVGRVDLGPVAAEVGEADVVEDDHHDVRRTLGWQRRLRPPGNRVVVGPADHAFVHGSKPPASRVTESAAARTRAATRMSRRCGTASSATNAAIARCWSPRPSNVGATTMLTGYERPGTRSRLW